MDKKLIGIAGLVVVLFVSSGCATGAFGCATAGASTLSNACVVNATG